MKKSDISLTYVYFSCNTSYTISSEAYAISSYSMFDSVSYILFIYLSILNYGTVGWD